MYFVIIDLHQLHTRLRNSTGKHTVDLDRWLDEQAFVQEGNGWIGSSDSMNRLSCSEILFSERRMRSLPRPFAGHAALAG